MDNPNEYDDAAYLRGSEAAIGAMADLWEAGASLENIESEVQNGLENAGVANVSVSIDATE